MNIHNQWLEARCMAEAIYSAEALEELGETRLSRPARAVLNVIEKHPEMAKDNLVVLSMEADHRAEVVQFAALVDAWVQLLRYFRPAELDELLAVAKTERRENIRDVRIDMMMGENASA